MRKNKKIFAAIGASFLVALASCGNDALTNSQSEIEQTTETTTVTTTENHEHNLTHEDYLAPKCDALGHDEYYYCDSCGKYFDNENNEVTLEELTIPTLDHTFGEATYTWSSDNSTCTATRVCENCNVPEMETVFTTAKIKTPATCENKGVKLYTAEFSMESFETQTKEEEISAFGHEEATPVKENVIQSTFDSEGSYDLVTYCIHCKEELSRENVTTPKLIRTQVSDYRSISFTVEYDNMTFVKEKFDNFLSFTSYSGDGESLTIPSSVLYEGIEFPVESILTIGTNNLKNVVLPSTIKSIREKAFMNHSIESITLNEGLETIGNSAFENSNLKKVVLPASIEKMGFRAFCNCSKLEEVVLKEGITTIGEDAFYRCSSLTNVEIPSSVLVIRRAAFNGTSIKAFIPSTVNEIGYGAFKDVPMVYTNAKERKEGWSDSFTNESVVYGIEKNDYAIVDNMVFCINALDGEALFYDCLVEMEYLTIPSKVVINSKEYKVTRIARKYFNNNDTIKGVELPATIESFEDNSFSRCSNLESLTLPNSVKDLGDGFGYYLTSIKSITIPEGVTELKNCFYNCSLLQEVILPSTLERIEGDSFGWVTKLETITISSNVNYISKDAFVATSSLLIVYNLSSVELTRDYSIMDYVALVNTSLDAPKYEYEEDGFTFLANGTSCTLMSYKGEEEDIVLPSSVTIDSITYDEYDIYRGAFEKNKTIKTVTIPQAVKVIGSFAFTKCSSLERVNFESGVTTIMNAAFIHCNSLEEIVLPDSVTSLKRGAFADCANLKKVILSNNITVIEANTFWECYSLETVTIPSGLVKIEEWAFADCFYLSDIVLPNTLTTIEENAFYNCQSIKTITIPSNVKVIPENCFKSAQSLEEVIISEGVQKICTKAFMECKNLISVTIPSTVTEMDDDIFLDCYHLIEIYNLGVQNPELGCENVLKIHTSLDEPSVVVIDDDGFIFGYDGENGYLYGYRGYSKEKVSLTLPEFFIYNGEKIGAYGIANYAFTRPSIPKCDGNGDTYSKANSLVQIIIPKNVTSIADKAFFEVEALSEVYNLSGLTIIRWNSNRFTIHYSLEDKSNIVVDENGFVFYVEEGKNPVLVKYVGDSLDLVLPDKVIYDGIEYNEYEILRHAFAKRDDIRSIRVSSSIKSLGSFIFAYSKNLEYVVLPEDIYIREDFAACDLFTGQIVKVYYAGSKGTFDSHLTGRTVNYDALEDLDLYYFTSNKENESRAGKWWYYDTDSFTIIEKIVE